MLAGRSSRWGDDTALVPGDDQRMTSQHTSADDFTLLDAAGLVLLAALILTPRLIIVGFAILDSGLDRAFASDAIPIAGFLLLPWTTVAYASMWAITSESVSGIEWAAVGVGLLIDVWVWSAFRPRS